MYRAKKQNTYGKYLHPGEGIITRGALFMERYRYGRQAGEDAEAHQQAFLQTEGSPWGAGREGSGGDGGV